MTVAIDIGYELSDSDIARFQSKFLVATSSCHIWGGGVDKDGYGIFWLGGRSGRSYRATHVAWKIATGSWPANLMLHSCDTPPCVNAEHLRDGSHSDNAEDRNSRGRQTRGERHPKAKLTAIQVEEIRALKGTLSQRQIARLYGVAQPQIWAIHNGTHWKERTS